MKVYRNKKRFFCSPLKRYLPAGAVVARYENATKIVIVDNPRTDQDIFGVLTDGFEYDEPTKVTWLYEIEPAPLGDDDRFFTLVGEKTEDEFGNVGGSSDGLPDNSKLRIQVSTGIPFLQNVTTGLWHALRVTGPDGNVYLEVAQTGVPLSALL